jgi:cholesterol oxidase
MGPEDWLRMATAMKIAAHAMFAVGAEAVFDTRFSGKILWSVDDIDSYFDGIGRANYIKVQTAHLQGGNVIHKDPRLGVVDGDLKVHGFDNLWICDGSVIPAAITLNLQLTIMALAKYAAARIAAD